MEQKVGNDSTDNFDTINMCLTIMLIFIAVVLGVLFWWLKLYKMRKIKNTFQVIGVLLFLFIISLSGIIKADDEINS